MASIAPPVDWGSCRIIDCSCGEGRFAGDHTSDSICTRCPHPRYNHNQPAATVVTGRVAATTTAGKRNREDEEHEEKKIARLQQELEKHKTEQARHEATAKVETDPDFKSQHMELAAMEKRLAVGVEEEINDRRKRMKSVVPGLTSSPYFTHEDVDSERWFKKLCCLSENAVRAGQPPIVVEEAEADAVLGQPVDTVSMPLLLRASIRFAAFRIAPSSQRVSICPPADDAVGNDTAAWLVSQREPKLQWSFLQLVQAAAGNQDKLTWQLEDTSQPQPREDLRGFIDTRKVSAVELKKKFSQSLTANAEGLGQLGRYGARDCKQGNYFAILSSLSYCLFVRITYINENEVQSYRVYPPIAHIHHRGMLLAADLEHVDPDAKHLQSILPTSLPSAFISLVRLVDAICQEQQVPITMPVVYLRTPASHTETVWQLSRPVVLQQTLRSLVISADHFDPVASASGRQVIIKAAADTLVDREEAIHHHVDGKVPGIRRAVGRVRITGGCKDLAGLVLDPLGDPVHKLLVANVDAFAQEAATVIKDLHAAGVWHRDVKPGNFLTVAGRLMLNDFDLSALVSDASNVAFQSGTPRFASPYLAPAHTYSARDDYMSLVFTVVELARKEEMDFVGSDCAKKIQLLQDLRDGRKSITPSFQQLVANWMLLD